MTGPRLVFITALLGGSAIAGVAQAAIRVNVTWTVVEQEISPRQQTHAAPAGKTFWLGNGGVLTRDHNLQAKMSFKQQALMTNASGRQYLTNYKMQGGRVISTNRFPGSIETVSVATNGVNACSAAVVYSRPRGARYYTGNRVSNGEAMIISEKHAENVTCAISNQ